MSQPNIWMIGDIQGCCESFNELLNHPEIAQDEQAQFWIAGDLVNRGPQSLQTLRQLMAMQDRCVVLLGNHDLHLLAVAAGVRAPGKTDTFPTHTHGPRCGRNHRLAPASENGSF